ncbi:MAG: hypothetical protein LUE64_07405, partial [Candidatus Gastranaerophilales bacterium]|nr:hypothetical protein [Candidatus Gastranaerophilales bacterium]
MGDIFSNLYGYYVEDIHNFLNSDSNILYISGFSGSGKSSVLKKALESCGKEILNFHHLCFEKTVADDFLLSFYDTFRMYALKQTITLSKNPEEEFVQKVNFYFKNLEFPAVVVIDNFETVPDDSDINDLLIHISGFENVKVILISKNRTCRLSQNPTISIEHINFEKINFEQFKKFVSPEFPNVQMNVIEKLY